MFSYFWNVLPSWIANLLLDSYVFVNTSLHRNNFEYDTLGENGITLTYRNREQFLLFRELIQDDRIVAEDVPIRHLTLSSNCDGFVDVGAYHGLYTVLVGKLNPDVEYYYFEPDNYNREILRDSLELNDIAATIREEVVTDKTGEVPFYVRTNRGSEGHSTTPHKNGVKQIKDSISISEFIDEAGFQHPFLKIDAEGEELPILGDLTGAKSPTRVTGLVELHPDKLNISEDCAVQRIIEEGIELERIGDTTPAGSASRPIYHFALEY